MAATRRKDGFVGESRSLPGYILEKFTEYTFQQFYITHIGFIPGTISFQGKKKAVMILY
jgi:hypothetical protein